MFTSLKPVISVLILAGLIAIGGCSSRSDSATDTTSSDTCFDVSIASSASSSTSSLCVTDENNRANGLGVYRFVRFTVSSAKSMTFTVSRTSGLEPADPDIQIFKNGTRIAISESITRNTETLTLASLDAGDYVLQIYEDKYTYPLGNAKTITPALKQITSNINLKLNQQSLFYTTTSAACTSASNVTISGVVSYDLVPHNSNSALDYPNTTPEPVKNAVVELICEGERISATNTDNGGNYSLSAPAGISASVFVRVKAQMLSSALPGYDFTVVDNTQSQSMYAMDSAAFNMGTTDILNKNLRAQSGWSGAAYTSTRVAAPFAILDSVWKAASKVIEVNSSVIFPPLKINWSILNTTAAGSLAAGQITSSHYNGADIYILGAADNDTDEYDDHVIIHEWGHYFEDKFSRVDSVGGEHTMGDILDIRVAFSEGFSNAYSAIASGDTIYSDSTGVSQASGFWIDLDNNNCVNAGWFSECSVQSIIYDLYDASNDGADTVSTGLAPIYNVLVNEQKNTGALISIFSFIKALKDGNAAQSNAINTLVSGQNIAVITDIYGDSELSNNPGSVNQLPVFTQM